MVVKRSIEKSVKYCYTVKDIAEITGRAEGTIRNDISRKKLNMSDLKSVAEYITKGKI